MPHAEDKVVTFDSWPAAKLDSRRQNEGGVSTEQDHKFRGYSSRYSVAFNSGHSMEYWRTNRKMYPTWAEIAFELLLISAMSAEVERVFSRFMPIQWS